MNLIRGAHWRILVALMVVGIFEAGVYFQEYGMIAILGVGFLTLGILGATRRLHYIDLAIEAEEIKKLQEVYE